MRFRLRNCWGGGFSRKGKRFLTMLRFIWGMVETRFDCPSDIKARFVKMCAERDETPGAMMRNLMRHELKNWSSKKTRLVEVRDEQLLASLRLRVAKLWRDVKTWEDFIDLLARDQLLLKPAGGGLTYYSANNGSRLAKASDVGPSYSDMIRRFKCGFPGHTQPRIVDRVLNRVEEPLLFET